MMNESVYQGLRAAVTLTMVLIVAYLSGVYQMIAPFSATCALLAALPGAPFSKPKTILLSHLLCLSVGMAMALFSPWPILITVFMATWTAIMLMATFKLMHAPAVAHTSILILLAPPPLLFSATAMLTAIILAALSYFHNRSK
jgi:CBS-domain-containing membrane protein